MVGFFNNVGMQMVHIAPVYTNGHKTHDIGGISRPDMKQIVIQSPGMVHLLVGWYFYFEHQQGNGYGKYAIGKKLEAVGFHKGVLFFELGHLEGCKYYRPQI